MKRFLAISILYGLVMAKCFCQQAPLYSQYMLNGFLLNPAVAGSEGYTAVNLTAREQWVGFQDGPATYALSFQSRILRESQIRRKTSIRRRHKSSSIGGNVGLGGYIFNHKNGAVERTGLKATYSYHIELDRSQLSFGLSLVGYQYKMDKDRIKLENYDDDIWNGLNASVFIPDADAGIYYMTKDYWAGFSVDQLFESVLKFGDAGYEQFIMERKYTLMGGYDFRASSDVVISSSARINYVENGAIQADISGIFNYQQAYWGGLTFRTGNSLIVMAGVGVDRLLFGYAFDIGLNSIMKHSFGTHEFTIIAKLGDITRRHRWLNRF